MSHLLGTGRERLDTTGLLSVLLGHGPVVVVRKGILMISEDYHWSRHFDGPGELEYRCPCPKAACGMVERNNTDPTCSQHPYQRAKTTRSGHAPEDCPGASGDVITGYPNHYIVNGDATSCPCPIHDTFFADFTEDDWIVQPGEGFVQGEHGGWVPAGVVEQDSLVLSDEPVEDFHPGGLVIGEGVLVSIDFDTEPIVRGLQGMQDGIQNMIRALGDLRESNPQLFEDVPDPEEYPMSSDAMRVRWDDTMEDRPL